LARQTFCISTDRLVLREFEAQDAEALYALNSDPEVLRYTGDDPFPDVKAAADFIAAYNHYRKHGFGRWAVVARDDDAFMGFCGLRHNPSDGSVDLGFRLFRDYWARGYATEAAQAALQAGFERFRLEEITGRAMRENLPSITVLQKLGMHFSAVTEERGLIWLVYVISKERFHRAR
jgi:RimJ/RimL family protein N-acetyltransferase